MVRTDASRNDKMSNVSVKSLIDRFLPKSDQRVASQTIYLGGITAVQVLGGLVQTALAARILGPEGYGALAVIIATTSLIFGVVALPGGDAVITFATRSVTAGRKEEASRILRFALFASAGLSLIAYIMMVVLALVASGPLGIESSHVNAVLLYGVTGIFLATRTVTLAVLRLADRVSLGLAVVLIGTSTQIAVLVGAWLAGGGLIMVVLALLASAGVNGIGMFVAAAASARQAGMPNFLQSLTVRVPRDVVMFQLGTFGKNAIRALNRNMDLILVAQITGSADVGLYRGARQIVDTARRPFQPVRTGVQAEFSRQWFSCRGAELRLTLLRFFLLSLAIAGVGFGLLAAFHESIIRLILGPGFSGASQLLLIMIPGSFIFAGMSVLNILPAATGRVSPSLSGATAGFLVSAAMILWLVPPYGAKGAAWANTAYFIVFAVVIIPFVVSILRRSYQNRDNPSDNLEQVV